MTASSDAGPLIWLGKCELLHLLRKLYSEIAVPEAVYKEVVTRGLEKGFRNARIVEKALKEGCVKIHKVDKQFKERVGSDRLFAYRQPFVAMECWRQTLLHRTFSGVLFHQVWGFPYPPFLLSRAKVQ